MEADVTPPSPRKVHLPRIPNTNFPVFYIKESSTSLFSVNYLMDRSAQRIIQWNCRGIKPCYQELLLLLSLLGPSVFCLQETFLKTDNFTFKGFNVYNVYMYLLC